MLSLSLKIFLMTLGYNDCLEEKIGILIIITNYLFTYLSPLTINKKKNKDKIHEIKGKAEQQGEIKMI